MKKFIIISLFGLLILAFTATGYSQEKLDFKASGFIDARSEWWRFNLNNNITSRPGIINVVPSALLDKTKEWNREQSYMETRIRLKFDAVWGKETSGTIFFEGDSAVWGDTPGGNIRKISERNTLGYLSGDRAALEIKNAYLDFGVPYVPVPITVRAGLQPFGIRSPIMGYIDVMGVTAGIKVDPVLIQPMWFKALEGAMQTEDDIDMWGLNVNAKVETITLGGYGVYMNANTYPLFVSTPIIVGGVDTTLTALTQGTMTADIYWLGVYADGKAGPVNINFDFSYSGGRVRSEKTPTVDDVKYSGWVTRLKVDFPWEKFNFGVVGMYGSGGDAQKQGKSGLPGEAVLSGTGTASKVKSYVVPPGAETGSFAESEVLFASYINGGFSGVGYTGDGNALCRGSVGGVWLAKLYGSLKVTPEFKMTLQGLYIGDTTKHGDTFGTSREAGVLKDEKSIGWEFDLINEWQIYKQLQWRFGGGLLFPGKALSFYIGGENRKPTTPFIITTALTYTF